MNTATMGYSLGGVALAPLVLPTSREDSPNRLVSERSGLGFALIFRSRLGPARAYSGQTGGKDSSTEKWLASEDIGSYIHLLP
jgi:hypothetical protein